MESVTRILGRTELADGNWVVRLAKPTGFDFRAGQWCLLTAPDLGENDARGLRRPLSIASSPTEDDLLFATKRTESAFKKSLLGCPPDCTVSLADPRGSFLLPEDPTLPLVFLAGGVGITPFRSLARFAADAGTGHAITLFYSNRKPEETVFLEDFQRLAARAQGFRFVPTMTRMAESARPWPGLTGRLNAQMIREGCPHWQQAMYFVAGPPAMLEAMNTTLQELGIPPERIRSEKFAGY